MFVLQGLKVLLFNKNGARLGFPVSAWDSMFDLQGLKVLLFNKNGARLGFPVSACGSFFDQLLNKKKGTRLWVFVFDLVLNLRYVVN